MIDVNEIPLSGAMHVGEHFPAFARHGVDLEVMGNVRVLTGLHGVWANIQTKVGYLAIQVGIRGKLAQAKRRGCSS